MTTPSVSNAARVAHPAQATFGQDGAAAASDMAALLCPTRRKVPAAMMSSAINIAPHSDSVGTEPPGGGGGGGGPAGSWSVNARLPGQPFASVAVIVKLKMPLVVGVPEMTAVVGLAGIKVRPGGSAPLEIVKVYGGVPPLAKIVWL